MKKKISIIGSTGSIGTQALEVIERLPDKFELIALAAGSNKELLEAQAAKFKPRYTCLGEDELERIANDKENDIILVAVSGKIGLKPTLRAIENGIDIALANKETLVMAGEIVMDAARARGVNILPVDSEHSAIHQCGLKDAEKLIITASGGPFLHSTREVMQNATAAEALAHPRWNMGKKITVDCATLMNKGLEVIEARHLFNIPYEKIDVIVHPQSIIHSAVAYKDGSVLAQLGLPSMHIPIQYALTYPERFEGIKSKSFSFADVARLDFEAPDMEQFPCLSLAIEAGKTGGSAPAILNAANEEAVFAFLEGKIKLGDIYTVTERVLRTLTPIITPSLDEIFRADAQARNLVRSQINID